MTVPLLNSRFKLIDRPIVPPGKCAVCGTVDRPVIDFGLNVDFYGAMYLCVTCLTEVSSSILQMVPLDTVVKIQEVAEQSVQKYLRETNRRAVSDEWYERVVGAVDSLYTDFSCGVPVVRTKADNDNAADAIIEGQEFDFDLGQNDSTTSG